MDEIGEDLTLKVCDRVGVLTDIFAVRISWVRLRDCGFRLTGALATLTRTLHFHNCILEYSEIMTGIWMFREGNLDWTNL